MHGEHPRSPLLRNAELTLDSVPPADPEEEVPPVGVDRTWTELVRRKLTDLLVGQVDAIDRQRDAAEQVERHRGVERLERVLEQPRRAIELDEELRAIAVSDARGHPRVLEEADEVAGVLGVTRDELALLVGIGVGVRVVGL